MVDWTAAANSELESEYPNAKELELDKCDFDFAGYKFVEGGGPGSASPTDIYVVEKDGVRYYVKVFVVAKDLEEKSRARVMLSYEIAYYKLITGMYNNQEVRNVVPLEHYSENCGLKNLEDLVDKPQNGTWTGVWRNLHAVKVGNPRPRVEAYPGNYRIRTDYKQKEKYTAMLNERYGFIMTRAVVSNFKELTYDWYVKNGVLDSEFIQYYAQLLYTLIVFEKHKFKHNDLHTDNILIGVRYANEHSWCKYDCRNVGNKNLIFYTNTELVPRIFDFDRSTWSKAENLGLEPNDICGQTRSFVRKRDMLKMLCYVTTTLKLRDDAGTMLKMVGDLTLAPDKDIEDFWEQSQGEPPCCYNSIKPGEDGAFLDEWIADSHIILTRIKMMLDDMIPPVGTEYDTLTYDGTGQGPEEPEKVDAEPKKVDDEQEKVDDIAEVYAEQEKVDDKVIWTLTVVAKYNAAFATETKIVEDYVRDIVYGIIEPAFIGDLTIKTSFC
jgi:hypothetical protein